MKTSPIVTVVVPSYNHQKFIEQRLDSIVNQTFGDIELIVIDDCSQDKSAEIIKSYIEKYPLNFIHNRENSGSPFSAWEKAANLAKGKYIWICESDDYADPSFLENAVSKLENNPKAVLYYCDSVVIDQNNNPMGHSEDYFHNIWRESRWNTDFTNSGKNELEFFQIYGQTVPNMSSSLILTSAFREAYSPTLKRFKLTGDWLFIGRLMKYGEVIFHKKTLNYFRTHETTARSKTEMARSQAEFILTKYMLFKETKGPVSKLAKVLKHDAVRFIHESSTAFEVIKALLSISIFQSICCGFNLFVSLFYNLNLFRKFRNRYRTVQNQQSKQLNRTNAKVKANSQKKVALIQAPFWGTKSPPLGLACLSAYLKERGYNVYKRDLNIETYTALKECGLENMWTLNQPAWGNLDVISKFYEEHRTLFNSFVDDIMETGAPVIGFGILWSSEIMSRLIASEIKKRDHNKIIIFGGPQCATKDSREKLVALPEIDYVVHGEGEETLYELLEAINSGKPISGIQSVHSKTGEYCGDRALIKKLDELPFADFDDFKLELYEQPSMLPSSTSRGCPNSCIYCDEKTFWRSFRAYSGDRIFEEIKRLNERYGVDKFEFTDSLVNGNIQSLERFCDLVIENKLKISWMGQAAVRKEMTEELLTKIKNSGCFHLCFGMEHSSAEFMFKIGKKLSKGADFDQFIKNCYNSQIPLGLNWMFGFPGETKETFQEDLDFFSRNAQYFKELTVNNSPGFCGFSPGSYAFNHPEELDIILGSHPCSWKSKDGTNTYVTRLEKYQKFCRHLDSLGIHYSFPEFDNENECIGDYYYEHEKDYNAALNHYKKELQQSKECSLRCKERFIECCKIVGCLDKELDFLSSVKHKIKDDKNRPAQAQTSHNLILIQAPGWGIDTPPLGIASLCAYLRKHNIAVKPIDINIELYNRRTSKQRAGWMVDVHGYWTNQLNVNEFIKDNKELLDSYVDSIINSGVKIIGFSVFVSSHLVSCYLAKEIKNRNKDITIIFGGPHACSFAAGITIIENSDEVDYVVQGEGEVTLIELLRKLQKGESVEDCDGLIYRKNGKAIINQPRKSISDIDSLPFPDFSDFDFSLYKDSFKIPISSSRGCVNRCIFCNDRPYWGRYRFRTGKSMFEEVKYQLKRYPNATFFDFADCLVNGKVNELSIFCDLLIENKYSIDWSGQAIVRKEMEYELLKKIKKSGCVCLAYGLESTSHTVLENIGKICSRGVDIDKFVQEHHKAKLDCVFNFMFGLPGETDEDAEENIDFIRRNAKYIAGINPAPGFCMIGPGTLAYDNPEKYGIDLSNGHFYWNSIDNTNTFLERLRRFEAFISVVHELGVPCVYTHSKLENRNTAIGDYFYTIKQYENAIPYYLEAVKHEPPNQTNINRLKACYDFTGQPSNHIDFEALRECQANIESDQLSLTPNNSTDKNWHKGVAISWATAFFIANSNEMTDILSVGKKIKFADNSIRSIVNTEVKDKSLIVFLDGKPLDGNRVGYPNKFEIVNS